MIFNKYTRYLIRLGLLTFVSVIFEFSHYLLLKENVIELIDLVLGFYLTGIVAALIIASILFKGKNNFILKINYHIAVFSYILIILVYLFLGFYSFFSSVMDRHIFWFYPGVFATGGFLHDNYKKKK